MEKNEIRKVLYKEKPTVKKLDMSTLGGVGPFDFQDYETTLSIGKITFRVPFKDMPEEHFPDGEAGNLFWRWFLNFMPNQ